MLFRSVEVIGAAAAFGEFDVDFRDVAYKRLIDVGFAAGVGGFAMFPACLVGRIFRMAAVEKIVVQGMLQ